MSNSQKILSVVLYLFAFTVGAAAGMVDSDFWSVILCLGGSIGFILLLIWRDIIVENDYEKYMEDAE